MRAEGYRLHNLKEVMVKTLAIRLVLFFVCICCVMLGNTGCESSSDRDATDINLTMAQYNSIHNGMTYSEVVNLLGFDGVASNSGNLPEPELFTWIANNGNIVVYFRDGKVVSKGQSGLQ